ncbi:metal-dependent transcriptional regulator [Feifania hominis]|uniref:Metal-dependent transcriptional regulator n=1 Tax=Feifania hominis TaxID=2763660 RepID=A0A926HQ29_9FIRM|nr:metal-dependent transcriptional regulator [Feifania hominis]
MQIRESAEDYLEAILMLKARLGAVRSIDIANELQYSKPSVSIAMKKLRENGYITVDSDGLISLTDAGNQIASHIYNRHRLLTEFFVRLGVSEDVAVADACKIEHDLSDETFSKLLEHARKNSDKLP